MWSKLLSHNSADKNWNQFFFGAGADIMASIQSHLAPGSDCKGHKQIRVAPKYLVSCWVPATHIHTSANPQKDWEWRYHQTKKLYVGSKWIQNCRDWKQVEMFTFFSPQWRISSQGHEALTALLITTQWGGEDSGAAESFSEGHLWLTVSGRPCHPASIANEQTQGFSFRFIIVTMNEFQLLSVVVLCILSSHQPVNHTQPTNKPYLRLRR